MRTISPAPGGKLTAAPMFMVALAGALATDATAARELTITEALFPVATELLESSQYRIWTAELEVRLLSATITFLYRNFLGEAYQQVPGFTMPSVTSIYGIRWSFIN